jgi:hypothetical protein
MESVAEEVKPMTSNQKYRIANREKINLQRKKYYQTRKEADPKFLEYKRMKSKEYYERKKMKKAEAVSPEKQVEMGDNSDSDLSQSSVESKPEVKEEYVSHVPELGPISKASLQLHPDDMEILLKDLSKIPTGFTPEKETKKRKAKKELKQ